MRLPFASLFEFESRSSWRLSELTNWSEMGLGGQRTKAGVEVSETTGEGLPVVFACVRLLSAAVAQLPLKLYERVENGKREASSHPLYRCLYDTANPEMTSFELRQVLMAHLLLHGSAYAEVERNGRGEVVALWPLMPWQMQVDRDEFRRLRFRYGRREWLFDPARPPILRLMINSLDGLTGRSPITVLREAMGLGLAGQHFASSFFSNHLAASGVISFADSKDYEELKNYREAVEAIHKGPDRAFKLLLLDNAAKYQPFAINQADAQFVEQRKLTRSELCGAFGVPPHMVADLEHATFSNVEHESLRWLRDGLEPHLANWEAAIRRDCLGARQGDRFYARFVRNAAVRGDLQSRSTALATMRQNGVINANEWRALEELDPISAADGGDTFIVNAAAQPIAQQNEAAR